MTHTIKNRQHQSLYNPEYNYNHKVVQQKKNKHKDKLAKHDVDEFLRTQGEEDENSTNGSYTD